MINQRSNKTETLSQPQNQRVTSSYGIDLSQYQCYKLSANPIFSNYEKSDLHYAITAMQKGLKPHTKIGIKRNKKRNFKKKQQKLLQPTDANSIQSLNLKCTEEICMKAMRKQFLQQIAPTTMENQNQNQNSIPIKGTKIPKQQRHKNRKPKFIRKKQKQEERRKQLVKLVCENRRTLIQIFGYQRLRGYKGSKCPRISRHQIKAALQKYKQFQTAKRGLQQFQKKHRDQYNRKSRSKYSRIVRRSSDSDSSSDRNIIV